MRARPQATVDARSSMTAYETYASRPRVQAGVALKLRQSRKLFEYAMARCLQDSPRILEIGPGDGDIALLCAGAGLPYVAIEGNDRVALALRARGHAVHQAYVPPVPSTVQHDFSCCFLLQVLEHMPSPAAAAQLVEEIRSRLRPAGALVVACPDYLRWGARFYDCDYTHTFPLTRRRLRGLLADQGMRVVAETTYSGAW